VQPDPRAIDDPTAEHPFMHKTLQTRGMSHCGVSIGVYGQDDAIIRGERRRWSGPRHSAASAAQEGNTATTIKPVYAYA
jgi:hypothetical protein